MIDKREIEGEWWILGKPETARYGVLRFEPDKGLDLETKDTKPVFSKPSHVVNEGGEPSIIGRDHTGDPVTLMFCHAEGGSRSSGLATSHYNAHIAFLGKQIESWKDAQFDFADFSLTHLGGWMGSKVFSDTHKDGIEGLQYRLSTERSFTVRDVRFNFFTGVHSQFSRDRVELSTHYSIGLGWTQPVHYDEITKLIHSVVRMVSLAAGAPTYLKSLKVRRPDHFIEHKDTKYHIPIEVLHSNPNATLVREHEYSHEMLFSFEDVAKGFEAFFDRWLTYSERLAAVIDLYFSVIFNRHLYGTHEFLFLAQALERYHAIQIGGTKEAPDAFRSRLAEIRTRMGEDHYQFVNDNLRWSNEKTLLQRLQELVEIRNGLIGVLAGEFKDFPRLVRDTRNYYTHFNEDLRRDGKVAEGTELAKLVEVMRIILQILILEDLGVGAPAIAKAKQRRAVFMPVGSSR